MDTVSEIASVVRRLAEEVSPGILAPGNFPGMKPFPTGWCQDASRVLGILLREQGQAGFKLVVGERPLYSTYTHVWLERNGLIVDITADQFFAEQLPKVIITTDRSWHDHWKRQRLVDDENTMVGALDDRLYYSITSHPTWATSQIHCVKKSL